MRVVVALGGNALLRRGEKLDAIIQLSHIQAAARVLAPIADSHDLLICHGNGPQVGMLAMESENDPDLTRSYPLDDLVAETQGMIGYWLTQSLHNAGVHKPILSVITQTQVDPTGHPASIGALTDAAALLAGTAGTTITTARADTVHDMRLDGELRLHLNPDPHGSSFVDGSWWPRSTELTTELLSLIAGLSGRIGQVTMVGYHLNAWPQAPSQVQIRGRTVQLKSFASDEPATVILIDDDGRCVTLATITPDATHQQAREEIEAAAHPTPGSAPTNASVRATAESLAGVATQLARHEGRDDRNRDHDIKRWCDEAAKQFVNAPIQAFVPILVEQIVRNRMGAHSAAV